ncbi:MAG: AAA family ATPase [Candidatus Omnitrophica bacterium]|nr:AAA family ATPase [Candidatus Omnitrophota bacterium]
MKKIFIAATQQNDGKTTVSLGLIRNFQSKFKNVGFIKPIGQRYLEEEGLKIDEDSLLIEEVCGIKCGLKDMSPVAVERGFTEKYINYPDKKAITAQIKEAFRHISKGQDLVVIEGTGHAGVGSVFDHSNAFVARLLGSKVIIVSSGGIGRPIDEIALNRALFEKQGVKILGAIINKVIPEKFDKVNRLVRKGLSRMGVKVLGVIPYESFLSQPTVEQILEETDFEVFLGKEFLDRYISRVIVGAMRPRDALKYIVDDSLLITPGDRKDMILAALLTFRQNDKERIKISGIILSGGIIPSSQRLRDLLAKARIPVLLAKHDTYTVAGMLHALAVKIRPKDSIKIKKVVELIKDNVDLESILRGM